jgi:hypothetical protein
MPKIDPDKCVHRNIHPGRVDGAKTICLDCEQSIMVATFHYANGLSQESQYKLLKARLEEQK